MTNFRKHILTSQLAPGGEEYTEKKQCAHAKNCKQAVREWSVSIINVKIDAVRAEKTQFFFFFEFVDPHVNARGVLFIILCLKS